MDITREELKDLNGMIEDTVSLWCDVNMKSGQLAWTCVEVYATAKLAELEGLFAFDPANEQG